MFCPNCGKEIPEKAKFCMHCSFDLRTITASRQGAPSKPPAAPSQPPSASAVSDELDAASTVVGAEAKLVLGNRYELRDELGRGGMGIVYLAYDRQLEMEIALKVLPPELSHDEKAIKQLKEEAKAAMQLSHPNIVRLHNFEETVEAKFLTMELIKGVSLAKRLLKEDHLPLEEVLNLAQPVCSGLEYAHSRLIIHRDIKPANIMVDEDGTPKITDFGIARIVHDTMSRLTQATTAGTLVYMSPEQMTGQKIDRRTDIYALGSTFYELLTGHPPFYQGGIEYQVVNVPPSPIEGMPEHVNAAILKALAKRPDDRFSSAEEFGHALVTPGSIALAPPAPPPKPERAPEPKVAAPGKAAEPLPKKKPSAVWRAVKYTFITAAVLFVALLAYGFYLNYQISQLPGVSIGAEVRGELLSPYEPVMYRLEVPVARALEVVVEASNVSSEAGSLRPPESLAAHGDALSRSLRAVLVLTDPKAASAQTAERQWVPRIELRQTLKGRAIRTAVGAGDPPAAAVGMYLKKDSYVIAIGSERGYGPFRLKVNEAPPELPFGATVRGSISDSRPSGTYRLEVPSRSMVLLTGNAADSQLDPVLTLANAAGTVMERDDDSGEGLNARIVKDLLPGLYHVSIEGVGTGKGAYALHAGTVPEVGVGGEVVGTISDAAQSDYYRLRVDAGREIEISAEARGVFDPYLQVEGIGSSFSRSDDDGGKGNNALLQMPLSAGQYYLMVRGSGASRTGSYNLRVRVGAPELAWGGPNTGSYLGEEVRYRFAVSERNRIEFRATGSGGLQPTLAIREAGGGQTIASETTPSAEVRLTPTLEPGNYEVLIGSSGGTTGSYSLTAEEPVPSIALGSTREGRLASSTSRMSYRMRLSQSAFVALALTKAPGSSSLDPKLYLQDAGGREIASDDDSGPENNSYLVRYLAAGTYQAVAAAYAGQGGFTLSAQELPVTGRIEVNESLRGSVSEREPIRLYALELRSSDNLTITMDRSTTEIDPKLELYDRRGSQVAMDDDGGGSMNARISRYLSAGSYVIMAYEVGYNNTGGFTLSVSNRQGYPQTQPLTQQATPRPSSSTASLISVGTTRTGRIASARAEDVYRLILDGQTAVRIDATKPSGSSLDPKLILRNTNGGDLIEDDDGGPGNDARLVLVLDGGVYLLAVTGAISSTGSYSLNVAQASAPSSIFVGNVRTGQIYREGDRDLYLLTIRSRTSVTIEMTARTTGGRTDPYLYLITTQGRLVARDDDSAGNSNARITETLNPGTYVIIATCFSDKVGAYTLRVR